MTENNYSDSRQRALVVFDVDNVLPLFLLPKEHIKLQENFLSLRNLVACYVMNTWTARRISPRLLEDWNQWLTGVFAPGATLDDLELAIVPCMPEAVDSAILHLINHSVTSRSAGTFDAFFLLSSDNGLREQVQTQLHTNRCSPICLKLPPTEELKSSCSADSINRTINSTQRNRLSKHTFFYFPKCNFSRQESSVPVEDGEYELPGESPTIVVNSKGIALWAAKQPIQTGKSWDEICKTIERKPSPATQLCLTQTESSVCSRGLARLKKLISENSNGLIGPCHPDDGLEISNEIKFLFNRLNNFSPETVSISPIGIGAVRIAGLLGRQHIFHTVRTVIPAAILKDLFKKTKTYRLSGFHSLDNYWALSEVRKNDLLRDLVVSIEIVRDLNSTVFVAPARGEQQLWFLGEDNRPHGKIPLKSYWIVAHDLPKFIECKPFIQNRCLGFRAMLGKGHKVTPCCDIPRGKIGPARDKEKKVFLVWAIEKELHKDSEIPVSAIQEIQPSIIRSSIPTEMAGKGLFLANRMILLPFVVPSVYTPQRMSDYT